MDEYVTHHVSCGLLVRAGHVFLVHRSPSKAWFPDVWDLPGGHVEAGESSQQALVRELREELGVEITPPGGNALLTRRAADVLLEVWRVDAWDGDIVNAAPDEHDAFGWFSLDEAMSSDLADDEYPALFEQVLT
ncbi:NUDIX hydrolase [Cryobacterium sinapicolor]|uniref:8-oxo-dGTP diphosphatase n=1 Tax=Cryobacterium sinapicolor TaxID=1259236 RepID=A0ABY2JCP1_9MICO|nr:NUDIX hydrolase [Cryobacterium sinapicolor]TFD02738.1 NUDIX hydrolase [Cryobacterium sinapicolor]